jgi:hypothetical protein
MVEKVLHEDAMEQQVKCDVSLPSDKFHILLCILEHHVELKATNNYE